MDSTALPNHDTRLVLQQTLRTLSLCWDLEHHGLPWSTVKPVVAELKLLLSSLEKFEELPNNVDLSKLLECSEILQSLDEALEDESEEDLIARTRNIRPWRDNIDSHSLAQPSSDSKKTSYTLNLIGRDMNTVNNTYYVTQTTDASLTALCAWLFPHDKFSFWRSALDQRTEGTGLWIFKEPSFESWLSSPKSCLWVHGPAGAGKTILSATIIEYIFHFCQQDDGICASYFFDFRVSKDENMDTMFKSLLSQIIRHPSIRQSPSVMALIDRHLSNSSGMGLSELRRTFAAVLQDVTFPLFVILDGLDEVADRSMLEDTLRKTMRDGPPHIHLLALSRDEPDLRSVFDEISTQQAIDVTGAVVKADIATYVRFSLEHNARLRKQKDDMRKLIENVLIEKADEMFRWVSCQVDRLVKCATRGQIKRALETLPSTLYETYDRTLDNVDEEMRDTVMGFLMWICIPTNSLWIPNIDQIDLRGLCEVSGVRESTQGSFEYCEDEVIENEEDVVSLCGSLVRVDNDRGVRLAHFSVLEYLRSDALRLSPGPRAKFYLDGSKAHSFLSKCCVAIMLRTIANDWPEDTDKYPSHWSADNYATNYWQIHTCYAQEDDSALDAQILEYVTAWNDIQRKQPTFGSIIEPVADGPFRTRRFGFVSALWGSDLVPSCDVWTVLCRAGRLGPVRAYVQQHSEGHFDQEQFTQGLVAACEVGNEQLVKYLLALGANPNSPERYTKRTSLEAVLDGALLERNYMLQTTQAAPANVTKFGKLVKLLVHAGANISGNSTYGEELLSTLIWRNQMDMFEHFLEVGLDIYHRSMAQDHVLKATVLYDRPAFLRRLIDLGVDIDDPSNVRNSPLAIAIFSEKIEIIEILAAAGADLEKTSPSGSALQIAARMSGEITRIIINAGAEINSPTLFRDPGNLTRDGHDCIPSKDQLQRLSQTLDTAEINSDTEFLVNGIPLIHLPPLHIATFCRKMDVIQELLQNGADVNMMILLTGSALHIAASEGYHDEAKLLLLHGADPRSLSWTYSGRKTPLDEAVEAGHTNIIELLS